MVHKKTSLSTALEQMKANQLFWQKEVVDRAPNHWQKGGGKPPNHPQWKAHLPWPPTWNRDRSRSSRGTPGAWANNPPPQAQVPHWPNQQSGGQQGGNRTKGKQAKGHSKGQGGKPIKGGNSDNQGPWVSKNIGGAMYCWPWNRNSCTNPGCQCVHRCCVAVGKQGNACNKNHPAFNH